MNAYDLTKRFIETLGDIDEALEEKANAKTPDEDRLYDEKITVLENKMFDIKNKLKSTQI